MGDEIPNPSHIGTHGTNLTRNEAIARLSAAQHGVVAAEQLHALGLTDSAIRSRVARGSLHRLFPRVFTVGDELVSLNGRWMGATLACGRGAHLSHRDAAMAHGLLTSRRRPIDVIVEGDRKRTSPGIDLRRSRTLLGRDLTVVDGIPVTAVARTLLDLAGIWSGRPLERVWEQAAILRVLDWDEIEDVLARNRRARGAARLRTLAAVPARGRGTTRSGLEERFLSLTDRARLPRPHLNAPITTAGEEFTVDCLWPDARLVTEIDDERYHRHKFHSDRRRDRLLRLAGYVVVRFTDEDLAERPAEVTETLAALLTRAAAAG